MKHTRLAVTSLSLSAAAFAALVVSEGWMGTADIPTKGDVPTHGFGSTKDEQGNPVKLGEVITPPKAVVRSLTHIQKDETVLKSCVKMPISQIEYDVLVDFAYQYGAKTACASSMVKFINQGMYKESCEAYLLYRFAAKYDCSTLINGKPNTRCWGVWTRSLERRNKCMAVQ